MVCHKVLVKDSVRKMLCHKNACVWQRCVWKMVLGIFAQRRRCSVAQCVCLQAKMNVITPPHPTQPKPDPSSVRVLASEDERYYPTPPTPPNQSPTPAQCVCLQAKMNVISPPTPPNQSPTPAQCVCLQAKMKVISPPHPTHPKPDPSSVRVFASEDERYYPTPPPNQSPTPAQCVCLQAKMNVISRPPPHPTNSCACARETKNAYCACACETKNVCSGEACLRVRTWAKKRVRRWGPDRKGWLKFGMPTC